MAEPDIVEAVFQFRVWAIMALPDAGIRLSCVEVGSAGRNIS